MSDLIVLVGQNPFGSFIVILSVLWASERVVTAIINRNKPVIKCDCACCEEDDEEEE